MSCCCVAESTTACGNSNWRKPRRQKQSPLVATRMRTMTINQRRRTVKVTRPWPSPGFYRLVIIYLFHGSVTCERRVRLRKNIWIYTKESNAVVDFCTLYDVLLLVGAFRMWMVLFVVDLHPFLWRLGADLTVWLHESGYGMGWGGGWVGGGWTRERVFCFMLYIRVL